MLEIVKKSLKLVSYNLEHCTVPQDYVDEKGATNSFLKPLFNEFSLNMMVRQSINCVIQNENSDYALIPERMVTKTGEPLDLNNPVSYKYIDIYLENKKTKEIAVVELKYHSVTYLYQSIENGRRKKVIGINPNSQDYWNANTIAEQRSTLSKLFDEWNQDFKSKPLHDCLRKYELLIPNGQNKTTIQDYTLLSHFLTTQNTHKENYLKQIRSQIKYLKQEKKIETIQAYLVVGIFNKLFLFNLKEKNGEYHYVDDPDIM